MAVKNLATIAALLAEYDAPDISDPVDNPLADVEYTGDTETDAEAEVKAIKTAFQVTAYEEKARYKLATDSEFWFAICFQTREQKDAFLRAVNWDLIGDKYLDGAMLAALLGIELPPPPAYMRRKLKKPDKRLEALTIDK